MTFHEFVQLVQISSDQRNAGRDLLVEFDMGQFSESYLIANDDKSDDAIRGLIPAVYNKCCEWLSNEEDDE